MPFRRVVTDTWRLGLRRCRDLRRLVPSLVSGGQCWVDRVLWQDVATEWPREKAKERIMGGRIMEGCFDVTPRFPEKVVGGSQ